MSSLTNGNDYKRGWEDGHLDALSDHDKNFSRMGLSWKFVFHGNTALDSYTDGYNKGYEAGINEKNVVRKVEFINNIDNMDYNSSQAQNILREIEALKNLNDFLVVQLCDRVRQVNGLFAQYITIMAQTGVVVQACQTFQSQYYVKDEALFRSVFERIVNYDLPQIRQYIDLLQTQFQAATGTNYGSINLRTPCSSVTATLPNNAILPTGSSQSFSIQIQAVCNLMDFLVDQRNELQQTIRDYERYCNDMINSGVPKEIVEHYVPNFARENVQLINNVAGNIQNSDYPYLNKVYVQIGNSLSQTGKSPQRSPKSM